MSDTPRTDAEECDSFIGIHSYFDADDVYRGYGFARQLERELTAAQAEIARLKAGGCARNQRTTQFCAEALKLQEENARLQERIRRLEEAGDAMSFNNNPWAVKAWEKAKDTQ